MKIIIIVLLIASCSKKQDYQGVVEYFNCPLEEQFKGSMKCEDKDSCLFKGVINGHKFSKEVLKDGKFFYKGSLGQSYYLIKGSINKQKIKGVVAKQNTPFDVKTFAKVKVCQGKVEAILDSH